MAAVSAIKSAINIGVYNAIPNGDQKPFRITFLD
jgi:hypothetical protein